MSVWMSLVPAAKKLRAPKRRAPAPRLVVASCHPNDLNLRDNNGKPLKPVVVWRDHVLGPDGPPQPMTRLVLLALASHMNEDGYAFPSIDLLSRECGCSMSAAKRHLAFACAEGWLRRAVGMGYAQGWRNYEYEGSIPTFEGGVIVRPRSAWRKIRGKHRLRRVGP